jgi:hypothetical protein
MFRNLTQYVCSKTVAAALRLAFGLACFLAPALQAAGPGPRLVVAIRDYADVPRETLDRAEAQVSKIFGRAGFLVEWRELTESKPAEDFAEVKPALVASLLTNSMAARVRCSAGALGFAIGNRAYIFVERTRLAAGFGANDFSKTLGAVMAHEMGHVLLGPGHAAGSVMSARLGKTEFVQGEQGALLFLRAQAERMNERIRAQQAAESPALVAGN